ncbi:MAG TPA: hypothetical protein VM098_08115 [Phycisphaerae bacterium]|nr:hypothetical protein [Phycisphaerae bacterium]
MNSKLEEVFRDWSAILDSVMPGGDNWQTAKSKALKQRRSSGKVSICLGSCPFYGKCSDKRNGPEGLCEDRKWRAASADPLNLAVLLHVLEHFDYYNMGDIPGLSERSAAIVELRARVLGELGKALRGAGTGSLR